MDYLQNSLTTVKTAYREWDKKKPVDQSKNYRNSNSFMKRKNESELILAKYPTRIPIIVERYNKSVPEIDRKKYLVPDDLTMANFLYVIRKRLKMRAERSLFLFVNEKLVRMSQTMVGIYDKNKDEDGFLYIKYCEESTFG
tara:strand:- start:87 stop:509 length:423 start_codon:yes stop_codon:yes gene_type:complete